MHYETKNLIVRDFVPEDLTVLQSFRSDPVVAQYMDFEVETPRLTEKWLEQMMACNAGNPRFGHQAAVILKEKREVVGWIGVGHPENPENGIAERAFGYALGQPYWGKGIMSEAIEGLLRWCFVAWNVQSVSAQCSKANLASSRVLEKSGMQLVREFEARPPADGPALLFIAEKKNWLPKYMPNDL